MTRFLLVVFDGLRPDMMRPDTTPHLLRFAAMGMRFARARSVFPSETRVCSASLATGCWPRRHGLVANRIAHPLDPSRSIDTGQADTLRALVQDTGAALLGAPALGEILAGAGRDCAVLSSGTTGQMFVLNPLADALGQLSMSAHGRHACSAAGARLFDTLDPPPRGSADRAEWIAEAFRTRLLADPPALTLLWLCEPDSTGHHDGLGSAANLAALRRADAAFGRILDDWQAGPHRDRLQIGVASDHGHATVSGHVDALAALHAVPAFDGCTLLAGTSAGIFVPQGGAERIAGLATWLTRQDWTGGVFAADMPELPPGVLPRSALLNEHARTAHVLFTLRAAAGPAASGLPGTTLEDGELPIGGGSHGGLSAAEMRTVLLLAGSRIRPGLSGWPAGLTDIAPTVLALLGVEGAAAMDGRVLSEALQGQADPDETHAPESWEAASAIYAQRLQRTRMGRHVWIDEGSRD